MNVFPLMRRQLAKRLRRVSRPSIWSARNMGCKGTRIDRLAAIFAAIALFAGVLIAPEPTAWGFRIRHRVPICPVSAICGRECSLLRGLYARNYVLFCDGEAADLL